MVVRRTTMGSKVRHSEVELFESRKSRDNRFEELKKAGKAADKWTFRDAAEAAAKNRDREAAEIVALDRERHLSSPMHAPARAADGGKDGGGSSARNAPKKRGTPVCKEHGIEYCSCLPKRGRGRPPKSDAERRDQMLQVDIPYAAALYLRRRGLTLAGVMSQVFAWIDEGETVDANAWRSKALEAEIAVKRRVQGQFLPHRFRESITRELARKIETFTPVRFGSKRHPKFVAVAFVAYYAARSTPDPNGELFGGIPELYDSVAS